MRLLLVPPRLLRFGGIGRRRRSSFSSFSTIPATAAKSLSPSPSASTSTPSSPSSSSSSSSSSSPFVFDRRSKRWQRDRTTMTAAFPEPAQYDYLREEVARRVADRLWDIKQRFPVLLDVGAGPGGLLAKHVDADRCDLLIQSELSEGWLRRDMHRQPPPTEVPILRVVSDEEFLPFRRQSVDGVVSSLALHWVNDLPGTLSQINRVLKPDCPFIAALLGGDTLFELRSSLVLSQQERQGGISPHISPFVDIRDLGGLLSDAKFTLTTIDIDTIVVNYPSPFELLMDLRGMAEDNASAHRVLNLTKDLLISTASSYKAIYQNEDGSIPATFQVFYIIGWSPSERQPKPLKPGSAAVSFKVLEQQSDPPKT